MKKVTLLALNLQSWLEQEPGLADYRYAKLLPKTKREVVPAFEDALSCVYQLLGGEGSVPLAALEAHRYRLAPSAHWLIAQPIECQADKQSVYCLGSTHLAITHEEVAHLLDTINQHLQMDGLRLYAPTPDHWLLAMDKPVTMDTLPLAQVLNQDIARCMPKQMPQDWKRLFVELEMLLHQHPVNQARVKQGQPKINACWFSGGGELKAMNSQAQTALLSDDPLICTLGEWVYAQTTVLPQNYAAAHAFCEKDIQHMVIDTASESLADFEAQWLGPVMDAVANKQIAHLEIYAGDNVCYDKVTESKRIKLPFF